MGRHLPFPGRGIPVLLVATAAWAGANFLWLQHHRSGQPLNIDEAGYLALAVSDALAFDRGGWAAWADAVTAPGLQAPLAPAAASLLFVVGGASFELGMLVVLLTGAGVLLTTAGIAARLRTPGTVWLSVLLVATTPGMLRFSRLFVFALPATLVTAAALYALIRSRGLASLPWAAGFGLLVGLMPMTRTMTIAFVPGLVLAAVAMVMVGADRLRRLFHGVGAALAATLVSATWLIPSSASVFGYLAEFGYGAQVAEYASSGSLVGALIASLRNESHVLLVVLAAGWALALVAAWRVGRSTGRERVVAIVTSPLFACAVVVVVGCTMMLTTRNAGSGFPLPLLPPGAVVAAWGLAKVGERLPRTWHRVVAGASVAVLPVVVAGGALFTTSAWADQRSLSIAGVGPIPLTLGKGLDPAYYRPGSDTFVNSPAWGASWESVNARLADILIEADGAGQPLAAFGFRGVFVNANTVQLAALQRHGRGIPLVQVSPAVMSGPEDYETWLASGEARAACRLLTAAGSLNEFEPAADVPVLERVAARLGFAPVSTTPTPDGRTVVTWERIGGAC